MNILFWIWDFLLYVRPNHPPTPQGTSWGFLPVFGRAADCEASWRDGKVLHNLPLGTEAPETTFFIALHSFSFHLMHIKVQFKFILKKLSEKKKITFATLVNKKHSSQSSILLCSAAAEVMVCLPHRARGRHHSHCMSPRSDLHLRAGNTKPAWCCTTGAHVAAVGPQPARSARPFRLWESALYATILSVS